MSIKIHVPALGESVTEATVATWFKKLGDAIQIDEMLCELETDKITVEVPSPVSGILKEILANEGETINKGAVLAMVDESHVAHQKQEETPTLATPASQKETSIKTPEDAPSAKKMMAEKNIAREKIIPTGRDGRVMKEDVLHAIKRDEDSPSHQKNVSPSPLASLRDDSTQEERVPMSRLRQTIAARLKDSQNTAATLTSYNEADMSNIIEIRANHREHFEKKHGVKLGFMSFFVKACCHALKEIPEINAEIDGTDIIYKNYVNMGVAVSIPTGLVVPVLYNADKMSFAEIEQDLVRLSTRAREGALLMQEMQGGSFTISNGGVYGSLMSSPILNPPQSGILGMHKIQERPIAQNGQVVIRPMMYLALSYDHRIIDGKGAVTFLVRVKELLENPSLLMMDI